MTYQLFHHLYPVFAHIVDLDTLDIATFAIICVFFVPPNEERLPTNLWLY